MFDKQMINLYKVTFSTQIINFEAMFGPHMINLQAQV